MYNKFIVWKLIFLYGNAIFYPISDSIRTLAPICEMVKCFKTFQITIPYYFVDLPSPYESRRLIFKTTCMFFPPSIYFCFIIQLLNLLWNSGVLFSGDRFCPWVICFCCTIVSKTETFCKGHLAAVFDKLHNILLNPGQIYIKDIWYGIKIALSSL